MGTAHAVPMSSTAANVFLNHASARWFQRWVGVRFEILWRSLLYRFIISSYRMTEYSSYLIELLMHHTLRWDRLSAFSLRHTSPQPTKGTGRSKAAMRKQES